MKGRSEFIIALGLFISISIIFYFPILFSKIPLNGNLLVAFWSPWKSVVPFKFMGVDEIREFYPLLDFTYDSLRSGVIPLWNPYNFSGYSHLGNLASAVFYPIHIAIFFLSSSWVLILLKLTSITLSGFFTYLYLKTIKLSQVAAYFGSVAFAFSATMQIWNSEIWQSVHAFLWLPLALFSIENIIQKNNFKFVALLSISVSLSIMAGYIQPTIYLIIISFFYSLFRIFVKKRRKSQMILKLILGFILGFGISAVQLIPVIEAYLLSPRSKVPLRDLNISFLLPLVQAITLFVPDFFGNIVTQNWFINRPGQYYENMIYVGIIPLILAGFALWIKEYRKFVIFFAISAAISLSFTFDLPTSRLIYDFSIPFLSSAIPIRIIFVSSFAMAILSAFGFEWWAKEKDKRRTFAGVLPMSLIFIGIGAFIYYANSNNIKFNSFPDNWSLISARNFVLPVMFAFGAIFILLLGQYLLKIKKFLGFLLILAIFLSSFLFTHKYIAFSDKKFLYPSHPLIEFIKENQGHFRYWGYGSAAITNNFATVYKIYSPEGYDPVNISFYNELLSSSRNARFEGAFSRSDAQLFPVTEFPFKNINDPRYRIMDILGIKHIGFEKGELSKIDIKRLSPERYQKVWEKDNFIIFENKKVFPRAFLADRFVLRSGKEDVIRAIYDKNINVREAVIVSDNLPFKTDNIKGNAKIASYSSNNIVIETNANDEKILVLSDAFYPGWKANINGRETKIFRADHAFRAVVVPKGKNKVVFSYQPMSFRVGIIISVLSVSFAGLLCIRRKKDAN